MIIQKIRGGGRSAGATAAYISDGGHNSTEVGSRVSFRATINTDALGFDDAVKELKVLEREYYKEQGGKGEAMSHWVLSWRENEKPTQQQALEAVQIFMKHQGTIDHKAVVCGHSNTKNFHVHVLMSRIDPKLGPNLKMQIKSSGATIQSKSIRKGVERQRNNEIESSSVAVAEICATQNWAETESCRYNSRLERKASSPRDPNGYHFPAAVLAAEAATGQMHAVHVLALVATPILRDPGLKAWDDVNLALSKVGVNLERVKLARGTEGAILKSLNAKVRLSALPPDISLKKLDARLSPQVKPMPTADVRGGFKIAATNRRASSKPLTRTQVRNSLKMMVCGSLDFTDFIRSIKSRNWIFERAGNNGARIIADHHTVKLSEIPGGKFSYLKLVEKFGASLEEIELPGELAEVVRYFTPKAEFSGKPTRVLDIPGKLSKSCRLRELSEHNRTRRCSTMTPSSDMMIIALQQDADMQQHQIEEEIENEHVAATS